MNKKIIIIIGLIVLLSLTAGILLLIAGRKPKAVPQPQQQTVEIKKLVDEPVISPIPSYDQAAIWYFTEEGRLFRINVDGTGLSEYPLPSLGLLQLSAALWPKTGNDFIALTSGDLGIEKKYYDNQNKQYTDLARNIQSLDWLPDGRRIVYVWKSGDNIHQQLVIANADGSGYKIIKEVFWPDLAVVASPGGKQVLLLRNKIYLADLETGDIQTVIEEGKNLAAVWLSNGSRFIFSQAQEGNSNPKIFLYNLSSKLQLDLNLNTHLNKIIIDSEGKILYAAVPKQDNTGDEFWKVDLATLKQEKFFEPPVGVRAKNLQLTNSALYFVNQNDSKLYYITR